MPPERPSLIREVSIAQQLTAANYGLHSDFMEARISGDRGLGLFATRDIPPGTFIFAERPLMAMPAEYPSNEILVRDLMRQYSSFSEAQKDRWSTLRTEYDHPNRPSYEESPQGVSEGRQYLWLLTRQYRVNLHGLGPNRKGVFKVASLFNHSCLPNVDLHFGRNDDCSGYTVSAISKGTELTHSYLEEMTYMSQAERQALLDARFKCTCVLCASPSRERTASDIRRFLASRLWHLMNPADSQLALSDADDAELWRGHKEAQAWFPKTYGQYNVAGYYTLVPANLHEAESLTSLGFCLPTGLHYATAAHIQRKRAVKTGVGRARDVERARAWARLSRKLLNRVRKVLPSDVVADWEALLIIDNSIEVDPIMY
ncbi:hypothetical protein B0A48_11983 [Cryoendolithus antarcticus]|uniref:SET domain-containing protein n=1 Tax=Cryoendolithus antarcticus TaxID=1507870 RepID=A0A1V8STI9_9PEZI|nr:hypothetical protein B0A48_11983 [Cryoendolithus antarcticus]